MQNTISFIISALKKDYPIAKCSLDYKKPHELLFSTRLSAQCTDARVNIVAQELYDRYPTLDAFAQADVSELEQIVRPCGFYKVKARDIIACANALLERFHGTIPDDIDTLITLPGVGRKTANLIVGDLYGKPAIVADTHCIRLSNRLGLAHSKDPAKVEQELKAIVPPEESSDLCHRFVLHGRAVCHARKPLCHQCSLNSVCPASGASSDLSDRVL